MSQREQFDKLDEQFPPYVLANIIQSYFCMSNERLRQIGSPLDYSQWQAVIKALRSLAPSTEHGALFEIGKDRGNTSFIAAQSSTAAAHPGASASVCPTCGGNGNHRLARTEPLPCETCAGIGYVALSATMRAEVLEEAAKLCEEAADGKKRTEADRERNRTCLTLARMLRSQIDISREGQKP